MPIDPDQILDQQVDDYIDAASEDEEDNEFHPFSCGCELCDPYPGPD